MRRVWLAIVATALAAGLQWNAAIARSSQTSALPPGTQCRLAIDLAERTVKLPDQLLAAIGIVETGRWDAQNGAWRPWPWTINTGGEGSFFETKEQAIVAVRALQARGVTSIDVGCMQVNLMYHPSAFASLDQAFDPPSNALYAARFLSRLFAQTNDWRQAAALYHSATPQLGNDYRRRVLAVWPGETRLQVALMRNKLAEAWAATLRIKPKSTSSPVGPLLAGNPNDLPSGRPELNPTAYRDATSQATPGN